MTGAEELQGMETAERQHAQAPVLQETAVEAMFLEELQDLEEDFLEELQDLAEDSQSAEDCLQGTQPLATPRATVRT